MRDAPPPTSDPELNALLAELVARTQAHFASAFVGAYLVGSFAAGDADAWSDVDWLVVVGRAVEARELPALDAIHRALHARPVEWAQHLEGSYAEASALAAPPDDRPWPYLDNGAAALVRSTHDNNWVTRWVLREKGISLAGPAAVSLIPPVPSDALAGEVSSVLHGWAREMAAHPERIDTLWLQGFLAVSVCRMLETLATGEIRSKRSAVEFARRNLDRRWADLAERAFLQRARQARGRGAPARNAAMRPDPREVAETVVLVRHAIDEAPPSLREAR